MFLLEANYLDACAQRTNELEAMAFSSAVATAHGLAIARRREAGDTEQCVPLRNCRIRCFSRPEQCDRAGIYACFGSCRLRWRRDFPKAGGFFSSVHCGSSRVGFDVGYFSGRVTCQWEFAEGLGSRNAVGFAPRKSVLPMLLSGQKGRMMDLELKNLAGRVGSCFSVIGSWPFFAWNGESGADGTSWDSSGLSGLGEGFRRESAAEDQCGRLLTQALAPVMAFFFFVIAGASYSFAATLADSPAITRTVELPPVPTEFPPLRDIAPLAYEKFLLPNGLQVFLLEDHELGLVGGELLVQGGSKVEPADKVGLASMSASVQRSGGSIAHPAEDLDSKLDAMAARIEASSSTSEMSVGFRCLTEDLPVVLSLFSEVVQEPLMPENKLELTRSQFVGAIARRPDDAGGIAAREFNRLLYGNESVYSRVAQLSTVKAVRRDDLLEFHSRNFRPDRGVLGIWGDFDATAVKKLVEQQFGEWTPEAQEASPITSSATAMLASESGYSANAPSVYLIDRPGLTQGYVRMGEFGTTLADPDVFALDVLNGILNGFGGLLFDEVRSREGLAYSVSGGWSPAVAHRGAFIAGGETRVQAIPQFVQAVKRVLENVTSEPPNADMLAGAKEKALNSFVFNFADSGAQMARVLSYELFGIDQDFLFKYKEGVETTTAMDVLKAAQRHLHPNLQPVLIVTDAQQIKPLLSDLSQPVVSLKIDYLSKTESAEVQ